MLGNNVMMSIYMYIYTCTCIYVYMYVCMYAHVCSTCDFHSKLTEHNCASKLKKVKQYNTDEYVDMR